MRSERWHRLCTEGRRRARWRCERCGRRELLEGHHWRGYGMLGRETLEDVLMLCEKCHARAHGRRWQRSGSPKWKTGLWIGVAIALFILWRQSQG
jgi:phage terminase large subunit GpA-like protein